MSARLVLLSAFLLLAAACSGNNDSPTDPNPGGPSVSIRAGAEALGKQAFAPADLSVDAGSSVTWTNDDSETHTTTSDGNAWNSGNVPPRGHFTATFPTAGTFPYHCQIHPGMVGTITVR